MHKLYELKEMLCEELKEYGDKKLDAGSLEVIDKLAHSIKNLDKIIETYADEEYSMAAEGGSYEGGGSYANRSYARRGGSYARGGRSNAMGGGSYARGRGRGSSRDSMGRYSGDEEMISELRELMEDAPNEKIKMEFQRFIQKVESM